MTLFITALVFFIIITSLKVFINLGFSVKRYKEYWLRSEGKSSILLSHLKLFFVILVITYASMYFGGAFAGEWVKGGSVTIGIQTSQERSVFCKQEGLDFTSNSNFTWNQNIWRQSTDTGLFVTGLNYTHHSCAISPDAKGYDKYGLFIGLQY